MVVKISKPIDNAFIVKAVRDKLSSNHKLQRLHDYYCGKHDILMRTYNDPAQPQNRIVENYCRVIADVLMSYLVGQAVRYNDAPQILLNNLNYNDNDEVTEQTVLNMNIFGFGAEILFTDSESVPRFASLDPRECIFVVDDTILEELQYFIRVYPKIDEKEGYNVIVYTATDYTQYDLSLSVGELKAAGESTPHFFNDIPAVFYPNNKELMGSFENVMTLQDALNQLLSDELNDFQSFVDCYLLLTGLQGTTPEDVAKMKKDRVILLEGDASAQWLVKTVPHEHIKELKDHITRRIRELGNIPDVENLGSFGSSGAAIKFKMIMSEIIASKQERTVYKGIQRKLELLYNIFKLTNEDLGEYTDVTPEFERNFIMLSTDKISEKNIDLNLVASGLMSETTFLQKYEDLTYDEAVEELEQVQKDKLIGGESDFSGFYKLEKENLERKHGDVNERTKGTATGTGRGNSAK